MASHKKFADDFADDLVLGYELWRAQCWSRPRVFHGKAKGQGFTAWLVKHHPEVSRRQAYRLIARWERVMELVHSIEESDDVDERIRAEFPEAVRKHEELMRRICDSDPDTNGDEVRNCETE